MALLEAFKGEIVRLKEDGLSNNQVAEFLKHSQRTKGGHMVFQRGLYEDSVNITGLGRQPVTDRESAYSC